MAIPVFVTIRVTMGFIGLATITKTCKMVSRVCEGQSEDEAESGPLDTETREAAQNADICSFHQGPAQIQQPGTNVADEMVMLQEEYLSHIHEVQEREKLAWQADRAKRAKSRTRGEAPAYPPANVGQLCPNWQGTTAAEPSVAPLVHHGGTTVQQISTAQSVIPWSQTVPSAYSTTLSPAVGAVEPPAETDTQRSSLSSLTYPFFETRVEYSPSFQSLGRLMDPLSMLQNVSQSADGAQEYVLWQPAASELAVAPYDSGAQLPDLGQPQAASAGVRSGEQPALFPYPGESQSFNRPADSPPAQLLPSQIRQGPVMSDSAGARSGGNASGVQSGSGALEPRSSPSMVTSLPPPAPWIASAGQTISPWCTLSPATRATPDPPQQFYQYRFEPSTLRGPAISRPPLAPTSFTLCPRSEGTTRETSDQQQANPILSGSGRRGPANSHLLQQQASLNLRNLLSGAYVVQGAEDQPVLHQDDATENNASPDSAIPAISQISADAAFQDGHQMDDFISRGSQLGVRTGSLTTPACTSGITRSTDKAAIRRAAAELKERLRIHRCKSHETGKSTNPFANSSFFGPTDASYEWPSKSAGRDGVSPAVVSRPTPEMPHRPGKYLGWATPTKDQSSRVPGKFEPPESCHASGVTSSKLAPSRNIVSESLRPTGSRSTTPKPQAESPSTKIQACENAQKSAPQAQPLHLQRSLETVVGRHIKGKLWHSVSGLRA